MTVYKIDVPVGKLTRPFKVYQHTLQVRFNGKYYPIDLEISLEGLNFPIQDIRHVLENREGFEKRAPKIPLDTTGLIDRLKEHNVTFTEDELQKAMYDLNVINYYRVSAFRKDIEAESFSYSELMELYQFDRYLRESLSRLIPAIEIYLKTSLARFMAVNYEKYKAPDSLLSGSLAYLDENIYEEGKEKEVSIMLAKFAADVTRKIGKDSVITHHVIKYGGQIPIWVLFEELTLGELSMFIMRLDISMVRDWVLELLPGVHYHLVYQWISGIQLLRNKTAHSAKLYGQQFTYNPALFATDAELIDSSKSFKVLSDQYAHTFFIGLLTIKRFYINLRPQDRVNWNNFLKKLRYKIGNNNHIDITKMAFPSNWYDVLYLDD